MADVVHDAADKEITRLARAMAREFKKAHESMSKRLEKQLADYERELAQWKQDVKSGKRTEREFKAWKSTRTVDLGRSRGLVDALARDLVKADQKATRHIKEALPSVYAENYNYGSYQAAQGKVISSFALYNEGTVANLVAEDERLLPAPTVNIPKDMRWNMQHVRSSLTQSFLAGESVPHMAKRLQSVTDMSTRSSIRVARTAITGAENRARVDSYVSANDMGIQCEKQWMAALDSRTRESHRKLDGKHVPPDEKFDNGCRFPGDPEAPAAEVYNCRCTLVAYIPGHNVMEGREQQRVGSLSYEEWKRGVKEQQPEAASGRSLEKFLELPSVQQRMEKSDVSKKKLVDAMREDMRSQGFKDLRAFKTLPKSRQQSTLKRVCGALNSTNDPDNKRRRKHAIKYYEEIRNRDELTEAKRIAAGAGVSEQDALTALRHLFKEKHDLGGEELERFYEDFEMAQSWDRLGRNREKLPHDMLLVPHEAEEARLMSQGMSQHDAHETANLKYNYEKALKEYEKKKGA